MPASEIFQRELEIIETRIEKHETESQRLEDRYYRARNGTSKLRLWKRLHIIDTILAVERDFAKRNRSLLRICSQ